MSLKIRLARGGAKKRPYYSIVVADSRSPRDGRFIEKLGTYNPMLDRVACRSGDPEGRADPALARGRRAADRSGRALPRRRRADREAGGPRDPDQVAAEGAGAGAREGRRRGGRRPRPAEIAAAPESRAVARRSACPMQANRIRAASSRRRRSATKRVCVGVVTGAARRAAARCGSRALPRCPRTSRATARSRTKPARRRFELRLIGAAKGVLIARLPGIEDRDQAEALRGLRLYLPRSALPQTEAEEYYHADLIGLEAVLGDGTPVGRVRAVHDFGAGDTLELARPGAPPVMVPFTRAVVPIVDAGRGTAGARPAARAAATMSRAHDLARDGADDLPGDAAGPARLFAGRQGAEGRAVAARNGGHPRFRAR